jgi:RNA polymerase sigma factor (sigma-70 family)
MSDDDNELTSYLEEIKKFKKLTEDEEIFYFENLETGLFAEEALKTGEINEKYSEAEYLVVVEQGKLARNLILESNLYLVVEVSDEFHGFGLSPMDVIREGNLGLIRALEKFDYTLGKRFAATARPWIRKAIRQEITYLSQDRTEVSEYHVAGDLTFSILQEQLRSILPSLTLREAGVVSARFGLDDDKPKTLDEIGKIHGVTRETIRKIERKTLDKLRHPSRSQVLRDYLD